MASSPSETRAAAAELAGTRGDGADPRPARERAGAPPPALLAVAVGTSGAMLWLAGPPVSAAPLAWVALVPVAAVALRWPDARGGRAAVPLAYGLQLELALVPDLPFGLAAGHWGDTALPMMVGDSPVLAVGLVAVPAFAALLYALGFGRPWRGWRGRRTSGGSARAALALPGPVPGVLAPALAWTALDLLRTKYDPGGFWGPLFLSQADAGGARLAGVGGPWLISFAIVAAGYGIAWGILAAIGGGGRAARALPASVALAAAALPAALLHLPAGAAAQGGDRLRVGAVQPGYNRVELPATARWRSGIVDPAADELLADLGALTREAATRGARLVTWPEAVLWTDPRRDPRVRGRLRSLARETGAHLVVTFFLPGPSAGATIVVGPDGELGRPQPKRRPMWFLGERRGDWPASGPEPAGPAEVGTLLGVDNRRPGLARALARDGASLLSVSTHDWRELAVRQRAFARLSAAATGRPLVRSDWRFGTAIHDADGSVRGDAGPGRARAAIVADVAAPRPTFYERVGDTVGWAAVALVATGWAAGALARRRGGAGHLRGALS